MIEKAEEALKLNPDDAKAKTNLATGQTKVENAQKTLDALKQSHPQFFNPNYTPQPKEVAIDFQSLRGEAEKGASLYSKLSTDRWTHSDTADKNAQQAYEKMAIDMMKTLGLDESSAENHPLIQAVRKMSSNGKTFAENNPEINKLITEIS
jgi:hypothetical protein